MKKASIILIAVSLIIIFLGLVFWYINAQVQNGSIDQPEPKRYCDTNNQCPQGLGHCYKIESDEKPICLNDYPCNVCDSKKCELMETFPEQVKCL